MDTSAAPTGASNPARSRRRLAVALVALLAVIAAGWLQPPPAERVEHFAQREVSVIAHAGAQGHAPSNTLPAFELALEQGADTLEMDLQLTADDEVVVIHDATVDRTTDGSGAVRDLTLDELRELDAGWYYEDDDGGHPFRDQDVRIPTLEEVFDAFDDTHLIIELKTDAGPDIIQPVIDRVVAHDRADTVTIASFDETYLGPVRDQLPGVPTNMPEGETLGFYARQLVGLHPWWSPPGELFQAPETHTTSLAGIEVEDLRVVTPRFVRNAERLGVDVQVWTVNEVEQMHRLLDAGVHGILTDYPDRLVAVLDEREDVRGVARGADPSRYDGQLERAAALQEDAGWLTVPLAAVTFLGDEEFYLLGFPLLYWAISRRLGIRLGVMLLLTAGLNAILKAVWATPRPSYLAPELGVVEETSFGLPSGHAQNGTAVWGLLAASVRDRRVQVGLVALIVLIGWSRIHLGVHFLEDVLTGWLAGGLLLAAYLLLEPRVRAWVARTGPVEHVLASLVASLALIAPAVLLAGRMRGWSFPWPGLADPDALTGASHAVTPAATLAGLGIGLVVLHARGGFDHRGPLGQRALRVLVGLVGVVVLWQGLGAVFPGGEDPLALVLRYVRYALVGAWVGGIAPLLFVRLKLAAAGDGPAAGTPARHPADASPRGG